MKRRRSSLLLSTLFLALALVAGCSKPARTDKITVQNDVGFDHWLTEHTAVLSLQEVQELKEARQNLRFKLMQEHPGMRSDQFTADLYSQINGKTAQELIRTSYELQINKLTTELSNLEPQLKKFEGYDTRGMDDEKKGYIAESLAKLRRQKQEREEALKKLQQRLDELKQPAPPST
jgi:septal ring factor EnvC (AmiA/AmiB activator)